ncbi:MAG: polymer-forming cytoskeletal protein [Thermoanaerobaculia bacterium]|nr:polymer-forming cytoskeletal protein [Thermoanaerobaculia bacterium]
MRVSSATAVACLLLCQAAVGRAQEDRPTAISLDAGSVAGSQVVALGRDVVVAGRASAGVAALGGSVEVSGTVVGDLVVLDGDVALASRARVEGDVFVLGGSIDSAPGAEVTGRSVAYPTAPGALLLLAEGPALGLSPWSRVVLGGKLALLAAWLVTVAVLVIAAAPALRATAEGVGEEPLRNLLVGIVVVSALLLTGLFLATFLGVMVGVPMVVLLVVVALVLKLWGMVAVFARLGSALVRGRSARDLLTACTVGLLALGTVKFLPWIGALAWTAATLIGIGATVSTKFGRRESWLAE